MPIDPKTYTLFCLGTSTQHREKLLWYSRCHTLSAGFDIHPGGAGYEIVREDSAHLETARSPARLALALAGSRRARSLLASQKIDRQIIAVQPRSADQALAWDTCIVQAYKDILDGPDPRGVLTGEKIAEGLSRLLLHMAAGKTRFNLVGHSRGGIESILMTHEVWRLRTALLAYSPEQLAMLTMEEFKAILFASPDRRTRTALAQVWPCLLDLFAARTGGTTQTAPTADQMAHTIAKSVVEDQVKFNLFLLDPVPGGRFFGISLAEWHDPRFYTVPENVQVAHYFLQEHEVTRGFQSQALVAQNPSQTRIKMLTLPGHHGTGSGICRHQDRMPVVLSDGTLGDTSDVSALVLCKLVSFLDRHGAIVTTQSLAHLEENDQPSIVGDRAGIPQRLALRTLRSILEEYLSAPSRSDVRLALYDRIEANMPAYHRLLQKTYFGKADWFFREQGLWAYFYRLTGWRRLKPVGLRMIRVGGREVVLGRPYSAVNVEHHHLRVERSAAVLLRQLRTLRSSRSRSQWRSASPGELNQTLDLTLGFSVDQLLDYIQTVEVRSQKMKAQILQFFSEYMDDVLLDFDTPGLTDVERMAVLDRIEAHLHHLATDDVQLVQQNKRLRVRCQAILAGTIKVLKQQVQCEITQMGIEHPDRRPVLYGWIQRMEQWLAQCETQADLYPVVSVITAVLSLSALRHATQDRSWAIVLGIMLGGLVAVGLVLLGCFTGPSLILAAACLAVLVVLIVGSVAALGRYIFNNAPHYRYPVMMEAGVLAPPLLRTIERAPSAAPLEGLSPARSYRLREIKVAASVLPPMDREGEPFVPVVKPLPTARVS